jgi:diguanylate cyclase (GGDEF)-like protein
MKISKNQMIRIAATVSSMFAYVLLFPIFYPSLGSYAGGLSWIPAVVFGLLMGARGGLLYGLVTLPINIYLYNLAGDTTFNLVTHFAATGGFTLLSVGIGWAMDLKALNKRISQQSLELQADRKLLEEEIVLRKRLEEKLAHEALHDPLTDLPNRRLFITRLEHAHALNKRNVDYLCAVLYLDVDKFKIINDNMGHEAGDQLLKQIADRLRSCVRDTDTVARMGGDEFAILLEAVSPHDDVISIIQRLQANLASPYELQGTTIESGISIGVTTNIAVYQQLDDILRDADTAMYRAKANGGNQFIVFDGQKREYIWINSVEGKVLDTDGT